MKNLFTRRRMYIKLHLSLTMKVFVLIKQKHGTYSRQMKTLTPKLTRL